MSKSDAFEQAWLDLVFLNTAIANLGDAAGLRATTTAGSLYFALHTSDPGEVGSAQTTNEISYTGYARVGAARSAAGFTRTSSTINPTSAINFGASSSAGGTATYGSVGIASSGAGMILYRFALNNSIACTSGVTPQIGTGTAITED